MSDAARSQLTLAPYGLEELGALVARRPALSLDPEVARRIERGSAYVRARVASGQIVYGANTGFGALAERAISAECVAELQRRHVVSHACGVGPHAPEAIARLTLLIKLLTFRSGHTGISRGTVERLIALWNCGRIPAIPLLGTVGASGDLAPLAHMALPLLGLGHVHVGGSVVRSVEAELEPITLDVKEGLALTNGIQFIAAIGVHCWLACVRLARMADLIASLSTQAFSCARDFFAARYHETSLHPERAAVARNLHAAVQGSNHHALPTAVASRQDPYSFRCIPQVHGAARQTLRFADDILTKEVNGVSDNPLFFPEHDEALCGGNLHGQSIAMVLDYMAIAMSELCSISERRTYQLLSGRRGLPDFLVPNAGLNSGFMVAQYTAAALVSQNKVNCTPASIDSIPTCQLQEDHVSMGGTSGVKLLRIVENTGYVLAIELLAAAQATELCPGLRLSERGAELVATLRAKVSALREDRVLADDIETTRQLVLDQLERWPAGLE